MDYFNSSPQAPRFSRLLFLLGPFLAALLALQLEFSRLSEEFDNSVARAISVISTNVNNYEIALEGFASFLAISSDISDTEIRAYVQGIRKLYPDFYMFEISSQVDHKERLRFEQNMRDKGYTDFIIHSFDYEGERKVIPVEDRLVYYPIRFIEPETESNKDVLGLDLGSSSSVLLETMIASLHSPRPIASRPFSLLEGGKGYVLYRPVVSADNTAQSASRFPVNFAMLVILGDRLLPGWLQNNSRFSVSLSYTSSIEGSVEEFLVEPDVARLDSWIVHSYFREVAIPSKSQPFTLNLKQDVYWSDFKMAKMLLIMLCGSLLSFLLAITLSGIEKRKYSEQKERNLLYRQANYDLLTSLPNLTLLTELVNQAITIAKRSGGLVVLFYLDIDKFKLINDSWGHGTGDELLVQIADRLKLVSRAEDTPARIHGDEFVVLLPEVADYGSIKLVEERIVSVFSQPFWIADMEITLKGSIGSSVFPDDGESLEVLLKVADQRMYLQKK